MALDQTEGEKLAAKLAFQLDRLGAMRRSAAYLFARDRKGRDFFARGEVQEVPSFRTPRDNLKEILILAARKGYATP